MSFSWRLGVKINEVFITNPQTVKKARSDAMEWKKKHSPDCKLLDPYTCSYMIWDNG